MQELRDIPLIDVGGESPAAILRSPDHRAGAERLIASGRRMLTPPGLQFMEHFSRRWAERCNTPYLDEIRQACRHMPVGGWFMNMSYEWGCTTSVSAEPGGEGMRLLRTLDWPFHGMGREIVVARHSSPHGPWYNIIWPGYVGAMTVMAPGRFSAAINQAPLKRRDWHPLPADWLKNRFEVWNSSALPPAHLLRLVCETCPDYASAKTMLSDTELALPVFLTLAGVRQGEGCVIERLENAAHLHDAPAAVANHWLSVDVKGRPRGRDSAGRLAAMTEHSRLDARDAAGMGWLQPPVLNPDTRLAVVANAASGRLLVQGLEADGPATRILDHDHAA
jgi:hypothetical protein